MSNLDWRRARQSTRSNERVWLTEDEKGAERAAAAFINAGGHMPNLHKSGRVRSLTKEEIEALGYSTAKIEEDDPFGDLTLY